MSVSISRSTPAGWFPDPWMAYAYRYWDGEQWTGLVTAYKWPPIPARLSGSWREALRAAWNSSPGDGIDLRARDLTYAATRFQSTVPYGERAQAAQAHRSSWRARRLLKAQIDSHFAATQARESIRFGYVRFATAVIFIVLLGTYTFMDGPRALLWVITAAVFSVIIWENAVRARAALFALTGRPYRYPLTFEFRGR